MLNSALFKQKLRWFLLESISKLPISSFSVSHSGVFPLSESKKKSKSEVKPKGFRFVRPRSRSNSKHKNLPPHLGLLFLSFQFVNFLFSSSFTSCPDFSAFSQTATEKCFVYLAFFCCNIPKEEFKLIFFPIRLRHAQLFIVRS